MRLDLLFYTLKLTPQKLDLLLAFEELFVHVVFFASGHTHLMLDIAELEHLALEFLPGSHQLFGLGI